MRSPTHEGAQAFAPREGGPRVFVAAQGRQQRFGSGNLRRARILGDGEERIHSRDAISG